MNVHMWKGNPHRKQSVGAVVELLEEVFLAATTRSKVSVPALRQPAPADDATGKRKGAGARLKRGDADVEKMRGLGSEPWAVDLSAREGSPGRHRGVWPRVDNRARRSEAELEEMDLPPDQKRDYERGKICFQCGVVKFGLFTWAVQCQLCRRYVCSGCVGKITLPSEKLQDILVCTLTTQLSKDSTTQSKRLESPERTTRSLTNSFTRTFERHSFRSSDRARSTMPRGQETGSRPRLTRARSMDKGMVASLQAMKLTGSKTGIQHNVCKDCKDMLTSIVRAQRMANKLDRMRVGFTSRIGHGFDAMRE